MTDHQSPSEGLSDEDQNAAFEALVNEFGTCVYEELRAPRWLNSDAEKTEAAKRAVIAAFRAALAARQAAEPVAWMWQHEETGMTGFVQHAPEDELRRWERMNKPRKIVTPLYAHPSAPDGAGAEAELRAALSDAFDHIQQFKARWMALPPFADKINRATREGMTMAHMPIMQAEESIRAAMAKEPQK